MNTKTQTKKYANSIKNLLIKMANEDKLPQDLNNLDTKEIEKILSPVFSTLETLEQDALMALDGDWDTSTEDGKSSFKSQIDLINEL